MLGVFLAGLGLLMSKAGFRKGLLQMESLVLLLCERAFGGRPASSEESPRKPASPCDATRFVHLDVP